MRYACLLLVSLTVMLPVTAAAEEPLVKFEGGIGATPAAIAGGVLVINTTRGVPPGGRPWVIESLRAEVKIDGRVSVDGRGLLLGGGDAIGTTANQSVRARLFCGPAAAGLVRGGLGRGEAVEVGESGVGRVGDVGPAPQPPLREARGRRGQGRPVRRPPRRGSHGLGVRPQPLGQADAVGLLGAERPP